MRSIWQAACGHPQLGRRQWKTTLKEVGGEHRDRRDVWSDAESHLLEAAFFSNASRVLVRSLSYLMQAGCSDDALLRTASPTQHGRLQQCLSRVFSCSLG